MRLNLAKGSGTPEAVDSDAFFLAELEVGVLPERPAADGVIRAASPAGFAADDTMEADHA
jgi:hypothetical protein